MLSSLNLFIYLMGFSMILSSLMVISVSNPVHSVFFLILVILCLSSIFLGLGIDFLGLLLIVVYVGAIAVLFLFVVMMLNLKVDKVNESFFRYLPIVILFSFFLFFQIVYFYSPSYFSYIDMCVNVFNHESSLMSFEEFERSTNFWCSSPLWEADSFLFADITLEEAKRPLRELEINGSDLAMTWLVSHTHPVLVPDLSEIPWHLQSFMLEEERYSLIWVDEVCPIRLPLTLPRNSLIFTIVLDYLGLDSAITDIIYSFQNYTLCFWYRILGGSDVFFYANTTPLPTYGEFLINDESLDDELVPIFPFSFFDFGYATNSILNVDIDPITVGLTNIENFGYYIYKSFSSSFIFVGIILLIAMIGPITLTLDHQKSIKRQNIQSQVERDFNKTISLKI